MDPQGNAKPPAPQDDSPWWLKHSIRAIGSIAGIVAMALGAFACVSLYPTCILAGVMQLIIGLFVVIVEAPCLCPFLDFAQVPGRFFDNKPAWVRALVYVVIALLPIITCAGISTFFGSGLIFVTGSLYGVLALGKKADFSVMRTRAASMSNLIPNQNNQNQNMQTAQAAQFVNDPANAELVEAGMRKAAPHLIAAGPGLVANNFQ